MSPVIECISCSSKHQRLFNGELAVHFPGHDGLNKPIVWVFPKMTVCMDCGAARFRVPEKELQVLVTGTQIDGAVIDDAA
jgi:hypothetical protein